MKKLSHIIIILSLIILPISLLNFDDTKDFETAKNLDIFYSLFSEISNSYVDEIAPGDLMERTIVSMLKTLDPYTTYIPESDVERFTMMLKGEYGGIGATIAKRDSLLMIMDIQDNSPAQKAGLLLGDRILEVDGHPIANKTYEEYNPLLQGQAGTTLQLLILRNNEHKKFTIERENIQIKSVPYYHLLQNNVGYIKLNEFTQNCSSEVLNAFVELKKQGATGLMLDLRNNPGGLLIEAIKIVNLFIPKGERVVYTKGQNKTEGNKFSTIAEPLDTQIPIVVLVNGNSASASEIVAGTLQDYDRAVIIGTQTFGKGLVQTRKELKHNSLLKITTAKYYIPSGRCIQKLDYTHRDANGEPSVVPDSLQKTFYTKNHRPVKDGGGIIPDVLLAKNEESQLLQSLKSNFIFYDYINQTYTFADTARIKPQSFSFSDADYQAFIAFCNKQNFVYDSESEKLLTEFKQKAEKEHLHVQNEISSLQNAINEQQADLFSRDKTLITKDLETEIIHHLYFERGQVEFSLRNDDYIRNAYNYLNNKDLYNKTLGKENQ